MPIIDELMHGARPILLIGAIAVTGLASFGVVHGAVADPARLKVCADPANLPFSNQAGQGFENVLAKLVAKQLGDSVAFIWASPTQNSPIAALASGSCDVVMGVPADITTLATTAPYYWSSYVFVSRADRDLDITSFKDARLKQLKIGVEAINGDATATPPAHLLAQKGLGAQLVSFPIASNSATASPARLVEAVAKGEIDVAALWGPQGGYFAQSSRVPLRVTPIGDTEEFSSHKDKFDVAELQYDIAMAVRPGDDARRDALNEIISENRPQIQRLLQSYGVPLVAPQLQQATATVDAAH
jgi:quinoprotein dehydrogenase-associated probable ABC transporter substrate-binding protein